MLVQDHSLRKSQYAYEYTSAFNVSVMGKSTPTKDIMALDPKMDFLELKLRLQFRWRYEGWTWDCYRVN